MNLIPALPMKVSELVYDELVPWSTGVGDKPFETVGFGLHVWTDGSLHISPEVFASLNSEATYHTPMNPNTVTAPRMIDDTHVAFAGESSLVVGGTARLPEKVDLTYVDSITIRAPVSCAGTGLGWVAQFGVFDAYTDANEYSFAAYMQKADDEGWAVDTDLDVSSLTGEYYVGFYVYAHTMTADVNLEFQNITFNGGA